MPRYHSSLIRLFPYYLADAFPGRSVPDLLSAESIPAYRIAKLLSVLCVHIATVRAIAWGSP